MNTTFPEGLAYNTLFERVCSLVQEVALTSPMYCKPLLDQLDLNQIRTEASIGLIDALNVASARFHGPELDEKIFMLDHMSQTLITNLSRLEKFRQQAAHPSITDSPPYASSC